MYRIALLEQRAGTWVLAPLDCETVDTLADARDFGQYVPINIYGPGQRIGLDEPLEQCLPVEQVL